MIVARYLTKEVISTFAGVLVILLLIALSVQLVGLFNKVASGQLDVNVVLMTLGLKSISIVVFILPLAFFLGILLGFSRLYQDSEMTALLAAGVGPFHVLRIIFSLAILVAILQAGLSLQLAPWAEEYAQRLSDDAAAKAGIKGLTAGRFREMDTGQGVIYAESLDQETHKMHNLFVEKREGNRQTIIKAETGYEVVDDQDNHYVILENGYRYEGQPGQAGYSIVGFEKHGLLVEPSEPGELDLYQKATPTSKLWRSDERGDQAELQWRISSALLCISLAILAVPLSRTTPRQGRYSKLVLAIIFYLVFTNLLNVARAWLFKGEIPLHIGLWWVHVVIILTAVFFIIQQYGWRYTFGIKKS
ncbi:MAG: LPS export ABC transporter permease LptF [Thioalkalispiraceae bacterium]